MGDEGGIPCPSSAHQAREKPIARLLRALTRHSTAACALCVAIGALGLLAAPAVCRKTFFDENALLPGVSAVLVGKGGAGKYGTSQFLERAGDVLQSKNGSEQWPQWMETEMSQLGLLSQVFLDGRSCKLVSVLLQPPRSDGKVRFAQSSPGDSLQVDGLRRCPLFQLKCWHALPQEAVVLITPIWSPGSASNRAAGITALATGHRLMTYLTQVEWLSKSVFWLIPEAECGVAGDSVVQSWLRSYHGHPVASNESGTGLLRGGKIQQALVIEMPPEHSGRFNAFEVLMQGHKGELPNLDMVHLASWAARHYTGFQVKLPLQSEAEHAAEEWVRKVASFLGIPGPDAQQAAYVHKLAGMASFLAVQLDGRSTGAHGPFRKYGADAVTLRPVTDSNTTPILAGQAVLKLSEMAEAIVHSSSNLLEAFHHSSNMFVMLGGGYFIKAEHYLAPGGLMLLAVCIKAAAVKSDDLRLTQQVGLEPPGQQGMAKGWGSTAVVVLQLELLCAVAACLAVYGSSIEMETVSPALEPLLGFVPTSWVFQTCLAMRCVSSLAFKMRSGPPGEWRKLKTAFLTSLGTKGAVALCQNWVPAHFVLVAVVPSALLSCPWRQPLDTTEVDKGEGQSSSTKLGPSLPTRVAVIGSVTSLLLLTPLMVALAACVVQSTGQHIWGPNRSVSNSQEELPSAISGETILITEILLSAILFDVCIGASHP